MLTTKIMMRSPGAHQNTWTRRLTYDGCETHTSCQTPGVSKTLSANPSQQGSEQERIIGKGAGGGEKNYYDNAPRRYDEYLMNAELTAFLMMEADS
jgi:hypothetical protein